MVHKSKLPSIHLCFTNSKLPSIHSCFTNSNLPSIQELSRKRKLDTHIWDLS